MYTQTPGYTSTDTLLPYTTLLRSKYSNFYKSIPNQMSQVTFTHEGVQQKLGELYNLSDAQLLAQAQQLNMNLRPWVEENFELNAAQKKYQSKVPEIGRAHVRTALTNANIECRLMQHKTKQRN